MTFTDPIRKEVTILDKNGEEKQKIFFTYYNLLIGKDLWQAHHQILLAIFLIEFITLNTNTKIMTKNVRLVEINISIAAVFWNTQR